MSLAANTILIRPINAQEVSELPNLWRASDLAFRPHGRDTYPQLSLQWESNRDGFIGAFEGNRMIGSVVVTDDGRRGWINRVAVHPDYRRGGLAKRLIAAGEQVLSARGLTVWAALVEDTNIGSRSRFASAGYEQMPEVLYYSKRLSADA